MIIIKHEKFMDVAFQIIDAESDPDFIYGYWINLGQGPEAYLIDNKLHPIKVKDWNEWYLFRGEEPSLLRKGPWEKITQKP